MPTLLYDWKTGGRLRDWKLEGNGEVHVADPADPFTTPADAGALHLRTYHCGPGRRATNLWLKDFELPAHFEIAWQFRSTAADGNVMLIFNALPVDLKQVFEDPRPDARYCDLASYGKIVAHTCGFHRGVYGRPSVLRKLGGRVPREWGQLAWGSPHNATFEQDSTLSSAQENLKPDDRGRLQHYRLTREENRLRVWLNDALLHDVTDSGQYPHHTAPLLGGKIAFRNFGGYADDFFHGVTVQGL